MVAHRWLPVAAGTILLVAVAGCGPRLSAQPPRLAPQPAPAAERPRPQTPPVTIPDPVGVLIAQSQKHFEAGQRELALGHLDKAKQEFNRAIAVLLESPYGARADVRLRDHFDRLVDRIATYEITALAEGDGFVEKSYEPASIDELLVISTFDQPAASEAVEKTVASDPTVHDVPIPLNGKVLSYIELFQGKLRDYIAQGLARGARYLPMIQSVFRAEGLPLDLAYVPLIESAFKPNALSRAKAKGVWQFMPATAREHGLALNWFIDERSDPEKATLAAAKYLTTLSKLFHGDWHLALASYNGGPGRVQKALGRNNLTDFWSLTAKGKVLPRETREYVPMILAAIVIARNPAQYGFSIEPEPALGFEKVRLDGPVDLRRVAEWTGVPVAEIQSLNPELRRLTTPIKEYELKVPAGTAALVQAQLEGTPPAERSTLRWHTVKRGESLAAIAKKLKVGRAELAEANYLSTSARLQAGQQLIIPREATTLLAARADRPVPPTASRSVGTTQQALAEAPEQDESGLVRQVYRVKSGDTLFSIARLFKTTVSSLQRWNRLRGSKINVGDRLTVFTKRGQ